MGMGKPPQCPFVHKSQMVCIGTKRLTPLWAAGDDSLTKSKEIPVGQGWDNSHSRLGPLPSTSFPAHNHSAIVRLFIWLTKINIFKNTSRSFDMRQLSLVPVKHIYLPRSWKLKEGPQIIRILAAVHLYSGHITEQEQPPSTTEYRTT